MHRSRRSKWTAALALGGFAFIAGRQFVRSRRRFDVSGRLVLITGGSRGLGFLLAREFARAGGRVAICARDADELARAQASLAAEGHQIWTGQCDVQQESEVRSLIARVVQEQGPVSVLVNNVGIITVGTQENMTLDDYRRSMETNFWSALLMTNEVLGAMRERGDGRIVNITSIGGKIAVPHLLPYCASKFALVGWSEGLRAELQREGIYVTTVVPGLIRTGSPRNATFKGQHRKEHAWFAIGDSLPITSMRAERGARQIVQACLEGRAEITLSWQAKISSRLYALFPGAASEVSSWVNRLLPAAGGIGEGSRLGSQSESALAPSILTSLSDRAARRNNEVGAGEAPSLAAR